jgi:hypothetical protein
MPDFAGEGNEIKVFPPETEQEKKKLQNFFAGTAGPPISAGRLVDFANVLKGEGFKKTGALGYCWGNV